MKQKYIVLFIIVIIFIGFTPGQGRTEFTYKAKKGDERTFQYTTYIYNGRPTNKNGTTFKYVIYDEYYLHGYRHYDYKSISGNETRYMSTTDDDTVWIFFRPVPVNLPSETFQDDARLYFGHKKYNFSYTEDTFTETLINGSIYGSSTHSVENTYDLSSGWLISSHEIIYHGDFGEEIQIDYVPMRKSPLNILVDSLAFLIFLSIHLVLVLVLVLKKKSSKKEV